VSVEEDFLVVDSAIDHVTQAYLVSDFESPPDLEVAQVVPRVVPMSGGTTIHLLGQNLVGVTEVRVGGVVSPFEVLAPYSIEVTVPPPPAPAPPVGGQQKLAPRIVDITVTAPWHSTLREDALAYQPLQRGAAVPR